MKLICLLLCRDACMVWFVCNMRKWHIPLECFDGFGEWKSWCNFHVIYCETKWNFGHPKLWTGWLEFRMTPLSCNSLIFVAMTWFVVTWTLDPSTSMSNRMIRLEQVALLPSSLNAFRSEPWKKDMIEELKCNGETEVFQPSMSACLDTKTCPMQCTHGLGTTLTVHYKQPYTTTWFVSVAKWLILIIALV